MQSFVNFSHLEEGNACGVGTGKFLDFAVLEEKLLAFLLQTQHMEQLGH